MRAVLLPLLLLAAVPAQAETMSPAQRACAATPIGPALRSRLTDVVTDKGVSEADTNTALQSLMMFVAACHRRNGIAMDLSEATASLAILRLAAEEMAVRLEREGVPPRVINDSLDIGPGHGNALRGGLDRDAYDREVATFRFWLGEQQAPHWKEFGAAWK